MRCLASLDFIDRHQRPICGLRMQAARRSTAPLRPLLREPYLPGLELSRSRPRPTLHLDITSPTSINLGACVRSGSINMVSKLKMQTICEAWLNA